VSRHLRYLKQIQSEYYQFLDMENNSLDVTYDVHDLIQTLYGLEVKGKDLKKAMQEEAKAVLKVIQHGKRVNRVKYLSRIFEK